MRHLALIALILLSAATVDAQDKAPPLRKYVGSPDYPALLREPTVKANLQAVVGKHLPQALICRP